MLTQFIAFWSILGLHTIIEWPPRSSRGVTRYFRRVTVFLALTFIAFFFSFQAFAADLNVIELNLFSASTTITLPDNQCHFLLDNNTNYSVRPKSENNNIFEVSSLKVNESSATLIFSCQNGEYVYQVKYTNTSPISQGTNNYSYEQRKNSYGYSFLYSPTTPFSQTFQLSDNSYSSLIFQMNHSDQDLKNGYYSIIF
jgi:hypothetical protein